MSRWGLTPIIRIQITGKAYPDTKQGVAIMTGGPVVCTQ